MSSILTWPGKGAILEEPALETAPLTAHQTLLERDGDEWIVVSSHVSTVSGLHAAIDGGAAASRQAHPSGGLFEVAGNAEVLEILLLPALLQVMRALEVAPDLGWTAVVPDGGVRSELLARLATECGARRVVRLIDEPMPDRTLQADAVLPLHAPESTDRLTELLATGGPVVAFDTRGEPATVLAILGSLPARSHLVLLESAPSRARGAVNFYRDVHRKNAILHGIPRPTPQPNGDLDRARRILRHRLPQSGLPNVARVAAASGVEPQVGSASLLVLTWPKG